jgi:hypothetical protein
MGITEQPTAACADQAEQSVHDVILEMLEQDPAFTSVSVIRRRGIGRPARLDLHGLLP